MGMTTTRLGRRSHTYLFSKKHHKIKEILVGGGECAPLLWSVTPAKSIIRQRRMLKERTSHPKSQCPRNKISHSEAWDFPFNCQFMFPLTNYGDCLLRSLTSRKRKLFCYGFIHSYFWGAHSCYFPELTCFSPTWTLPRSPSGGSREGREGRATPGPRFLHFYTVFGKIGQIVVWRPILWVGASGKSWFRPCLSQRKTLHCYLFDSNELPWSSLKKTKRVGTQANDLCVKVFTYESYFCGREFFTLVALQIPSIHTHKTNRPVFWTHCTFLHGTLFTGFVFEISIPAWIKNEQGKL